MNITIDHGRELENSVREHRNAELFRLIKTKARVEITYIANVVDPFTKKKLRPIITVTAKDERACKATAKIKLRAMYPDMKVTRIKVRNLRYLLGPNDEPLS